MIVFDLQQTAPVIFPGAVCFTIYVYCGIRLENSLCAV